MDTLLQVLPLPKEIIDVIASYDRILSINPISKTDCRYEILKTIPEKRTTFYGKDEVRGCGMLVLHIRNICYHWFWKKYLKICIRT